MGLDPEANIRFGLFTLRTECPRCGAHLPVNGPVHKVDCADCGARVQVPRDLLVGAADTFEDNWPKPDFAGTLVRDAMTWRWTVKSSDTVPCPSCGEALDEAVTVSGKTQVGCGHCGARVQSFPAPKMLKNRSDAVQVINGAAELTRRSGPAKPVAMQCPQCAGALTITDKHQRVCPCDYCGSSIHLPDAVWRELHPPRLVEDWAVRFEGQSRASRRMAEELKKREARQRAAERKREKKEARAAAEREEKERKAEERRQKKLEAQARREELERLDLMRSRWTGPVYWLGWPLVLASSALMALATTTYIATSAHMVPRGLAPRWLLHWLGPSFVAVAAAGGLGALLWTVVAMVVRGRQPWGRSFLMVGMWLGMLAMPLFGPLVGPVLLFMTWVNSGFNINEKRKAPFRDALPMVLQLAVLGVFIHVCYAAAGDMTIGELLRWMWENIPED